MCRTNKLDDYIYSSSSSIWLHAYILVRRLPYFHTLCYICAGDCDSSGSEFEFSEDEVEKQPSPIPEPDSDWEDLSLDKQDKHHDQDVSSCVLPDPDAGEEGILYYSDLYGNGGGGRGPSTS